MNADTRKILEHECLSLSEAAAALGLSVAGAHYLVRAGTLEAVMVGSSFITTKKDVQAVLLARNDTSPTPYRQPIS